MADKITSKDLQQTLGQFGTGGLEMLAGARGRLGPDLFRSLQDLLGQGPDYLSLNQQLSDIGTTSAGDIQGLRDEAARRGMGGFSGVDALASSRGAAAGRQRVGAIAGERERTINRHMQVIDMIRQMLFGEELGATGQFLGESHFNKQRSDQRRAALIGGLTKLSGGGMNLAGTLLKKGD